jgi:hypothetical protein
LAETRGAFRTETRISASNAERRAVRLLKLFVGCSLALTCAYAWGEGESVAKAQQSDQKSVIAWDKVKGHASQRLTVEGPVVGVTRATGTNGSPTFLNIGKPSPDPERFVVLIWAPDLGKFRDTPEKLYNGKTIRVTGLIVSYKGVLTIQAKEPSAITVAK